MIDIRDHAELRGPRSRLQNIKAEMERPAEGARLDERAIWAHYLRFIDLLQMAERVDNANTAELLELAREIGERLTVAPTKYRIELSAGPAPGASHYRLKDDGGRVVAEDDVPNDPDRTEAGSRAGVFAVSDADGRKIPRADIEIEMVWFKS
jgi:hypothetical protein